MRRRALLGTLASIAVAGCTGRTVPNDSPTDDPTSSTPAPSTDQPTTNSKSDPAYPSTLGVPAEQADCPPFDDDTERVVCYPEHADASLSLAPSSDAVDLPADVTFTLANNTDTAFGTNFYGWSLWKREDSQWFHIAPHVTPDPLHVVLSGESHEWHVTMTNAENADAGASGQQDITLAGLGGGEYAFATDGWFEGDDHEDKIGLGARFDLRGDPVELTPTEDASTTRDGDTVVVTTDAESTERAAFVVEREGVPPDQPLRHRITEQLLRPGLPADDPNVFRNTIPFFEDGVSTVRLETQTGTSPPFGVNDPYYLEYEDEQYRVSAESLE
jgi:hypothetical protein